MTASESENATHKVAPYPFDSPSADIILFTPNLTEFHVLSSILSIASPVFRDMFSLPQQQDNGGAPNAAQHAIHVTEDSSSLDRLLRLCYPTSKPPLDVLDDIVLVLDAAMKYHMEWMIPILTKELKAAIPQNPVKAWAVASHADVASEDIAREAASAILANVRSRAHEGSAEPGTPASHLTILDAIVRGQGDRVLHGVSAGNYFRLRQFILSESTNSSFRLLTPPQESASHTTTPEAPLPSASILRLGPPDILLQCLDGAEVEAHSFVVGFHSPILKEEIEASELVRSQSYDQVHNVIYRQQEPSRPSLIISLEATSSETLAVLLGLCYGSVSPPSHLPLLASALIASKKYAMGQVEKLIMERWDQLAELNPLEAYFIAVQTGPELEACTRAAARAVLKHPLADSYVYAMESSSALAYQGLLDYYRSCTDALKGHFRRVIDKWNNPPQVHENYAPRHTDVVAAYISSLAERVGSECHGPDAALDIDLSGLLCRFCSSRSSGREMLWSWKVQGYCTWIVDELLDISATKDAAAQVSVNIVVHYTRYATNTTVLGEAGFKHAAVD